MSFFKINFQKKAIELTPPDKRSNSFIGWVSALFSQLQYNSDSLFTDYKEGAGYVAPYNVLVVYSQYNRVRYGQSIYESLIDGNTYNPTDSNYWRVYQEYFVGVDERILYNSKVLVLEYALNTRFGSTFNQPPIQSDIFLTVNTIPSRPFQVGSDEFNSSVTYSDKSLEFVVNEYFAPVATANLNINVPIALFNSLANDDNTRTNIIRTFADKYVPAGILYTIITY